VKICLACLTQYVLQLVSETDGIAIIVELMVRSGGSRGKIGNGRKENGKTETEIGKLRPIAIQYNIN